ncbi:hypothetical protein [Roseomonas sp. BN140053]|uniref:hypothetical protein n=1 Tax=Roseomonas sp. BN140053 TaxID=3391898 RepID=UPI0039EBC1CC
MSDKPRPLAGDWSEASRKTEQSWDKEPGKAKDAPEQPAEESMERTEEGYGSGKDGADPAKDDDGRMPDHPAR